MRRADRLFAIVERLRRRRFVTAAWLAEELGVSERTIYRDVRDLSRSGVPIVGEAGVGYTLMSGHELPPLTFTHDELEALVLGARLVEAWADRDLARAARAALAKVDAVLPAPLKKRLESTALFAIDRPWRDAVTRNLADIRDAVAQRKKLRIGYQRADGQPSERVIRPLGLYFWGMKWSLAAWCELRQDYRNFRPDRIQRLEVTGERFDDSDGVTLEEFLRVTTERDGRPP